jgi:hypothetical protein
LHKTQNTKHKTVIYLLIAFIPCQTEPLIITVKAIVAPMPKLNAKVEIIEQVLPEGPNDWIHVQEQHMLYYPSEARMYDSLKHKIQGLCNSKKPTGDPTCPAIIRHVKRMWNRIKEKMDCSDGEGLVNDARVGGGDDDVGGEEEGVEKTTENLGEVSDEVASGEEMCTTTSRTEMTGRGSR